jgi:transcriptional regulator with XRE-family HTH domain
MMHKRIAREIMVSDKEFLSMDQRHASRLGTYLRKQRESLGLSTHDIGQRTKINQATIVRIEQGSILSPDPAKLMRIADALKLDSADVLMRAGYPVPSERLAPTVYLRARYRDLPDADFEALQRDVMHVLERHGVDHFDGPDAGEDERPDTARSPRTTKTPTKKKGGTR